MFVNAVAEVNWKLQLLPKQQKGIKRSTGEGNVSRATFPLEVERKTVCLRTLLLSAEAFNAINIW